MANNDRPRRIIAATDILSGTWTSAAYPFRYVVIFHGKEWVARYRNTMVDTVLSAVETLETEGWDLISVDEAVSLACMRRRDPAGPGASPVA